MRKIVAVLALACAFAPTAEARTHHHRHHSHGYSYAGRPAAWCGWYMRTQVGGDPGPQYNLARAWAHYGVSTGGRRSAPSSCGLITSAGLSARRTVSGSCRAAMTDTPFARDRDRWPAPSPSGGMPRLESRLPETNPRGPGVFRRRGRSFSAQAQPWFRTWNVPSWQAFGLRSFATGGCWHAASPEHGRRPGSDIQSGPGARGLLGAQG